MVNVLALDIGIRRTGVAFVDASTDVPVPLDTLKHTSENELVGLVMDIARKRDCDICVIGLPLLPDGTEGSQVEIVKRIAQRLEKNGLEVSFMDERYTTQNIPGVDGDASAACTLLNLYIERKGNS